MADFFVTLVGGTLNGVFLVIFLLKVGVGLFDDALVTLLLFGLGGDMPDPSSETFFPLKLGKGTFDDMLGSSRSMTSCVLELGGGTLDDILEKKQLAMCVKRCAIKTLTARIEGEGRKLHEVRRKLRMRCRKLEDVRRSVRTYV